MSCYDTKRASDRMPPAAFRAPGAPLKAAKTLRLIGGPIRYLHRSRRVHPPRQDGVVTIRTLLPGTGEKYGRAISPSRLDSAAVVSITAPRPVLRFLALTARATLAPRAFSSDFLLGDGYRTEAYPGRGPSRVGSPREKASVPSPYDLFRGEAGGVSLVGRRHFARTARRCTEYSRSAAWPGPAGIGQQAPLGALTVTVAAKGRRSLTLKISRDGERVYYIRLIGADGQPVASFSPTITASPDGAWRFELSPFGQPTRAEIILAKEVERKVYPVTLTIK